MAALIATSLVTGLLLIVDAAFSQVLAVTRAKSGVHYGSGEQGKQDLTHLVRAQANVQEYTPVLILAFLLTEYNQLIGASTLYTLAFVIAVARLGHGLQLALPNAVPLPFRAGGTLLTVGTLVWFGVLNAKFGLANKP